MIHHSAPLAEAADQLRNGKQNLESYVAEICDRIESFDPDIEAFLPEPDRRNRVADEVDRLESEYPEVNERPPLFGIPVGVKDTYHVDGFPTEAGTDVPAEVLAGPEASSVARIRDAGGIVLGKTVTTEFAFAAPGPTRNPHDLGHTPGGSSSGSAAAVAAGMCPLALGTQAGGSTIRPAAFCGVFGFKPTYGRIPKDGIVPFSTSVDHVGMFTQDLVGIKLASSVLCDEWVDIERDEKPTLGIPEGPYLSQASTLGLDHFEDQVSALEASGFQVRPVDVLEDVEEINDNLFDVIAAELALSHHNWFEEYDDRYGPEISEIIVDGYDVTAEEIARIRSDQRSVRDRLDDKMREEGVDVWISPSTPGPAPEGIDSTGDPVMNIPWTYAGLPALSIPAGRTSDGLPLGLQCVSAFNRDESLLEWATPMTEALSPVRE